MSMRTFLVLAVTAALSLLAGEACRAQEATSIADVKHEGPVDFEKEILPILRRNCLACHNATKHESDLILETPETIRKGGAAGESVLPGKGLESYLLKVAAFQEEPFMPPPTNTVGAKKLTPEELGLLKLWIDEGAAGSVSAPQPIAFRPLPEKFRPIYATAITADGRIAAAARANQIFVHHLPSKRDLGRLVDPSLVENGIYKEPVAAHIDFVESLAFSPTGDRLASGSFRTIHIWKKQWPLTFGSLEEAPATPTASATTADGQLAAVAEATGIIKLYTADGGKPVKLFSAAGGVRSLSFSGDGKELLALTTEKGVQILRVEDGAAVAYLPLAKPATNAAFASGSARVVVGADEGVLRVYDRAALAADPSAAADSIAVQKEIALPAGSVTQLVALQGDDVAVAGEEGNLRIVNVVSGEAAAKVAHGAPITALTLDPSGTHAATIGGGATKLWRLSDKALVAELKGDLRGQNAAAHAERLVVKADQAINNAKADLAQAEKEQKEEEENLKKAAEAKAAAEKELAQKKEASKKPLEDKAAADAEATKLAEAQAVAMKAKEEAEKAGNQETLAAADAALAKATQEANAAKEKVKQLDGPAKKAMEELANAERALESTTRALERAQESVERAKNAVPAARQVVAQAEEARKQRGAELEAAKQQAAALEKPMVRAAFTRDGKTLATVAENGDLYTWDAATGAALEVHSTGVESPAALAALREDRVLLAGSDAKTTIQGANAYWTLERTIGDVNDPSRIVDRVLALDFSPDGKLIASGGGEPSRSGELKIWNVETGELVTAFNEAHSDTINAIAFSPDGGRIATCGSDRFAKIFDLAEAKLIRPLEGHTHYVLGVAWRADGRMVATSGADAVIKIWDARTGDQLRTIQGYAKEVNTIRFVGLTDQVITTSGDNAVRIKNAGNGQGVRDLGGATDYMFSLGVSADGKTIVAGGQDGVLRVWNDQGQPVANFESPK